MPKKEQFVLLPYGMIDSSQWWKLPFSAQSVYIYMRRSVFKKIGGRVLNNDPGRVWFSYSDCHGMNKKTWLAARDALREGGFIELLEPAMFTPKKKGLYAFSHKWKDYEQS